MLPLVTESIRYNQGDIRDEKELFLIECLAQYKSPQEVADLYNTKFPDVKRISKESIKYYKRTRAPVIEQLREKFIARTMHIPIADEKVRLKRTEDLYNAAANVVARKDRSVLSAVETSLKCLKEAREEIKGESSSGGNTFLQLNQYNELSNEQLIEEKNRLEKKFIELKRRGNGYEVQST